MTWKWDQPRGKWTEIFKMNEVNFVGFEIWVLWIFMHVLAHMYIVKKKKKYSEARSQNKNYEFMIEREKISVNLVLQTYITGSLGWKLLGRKASYRSIGREHMYMYVWIIGRSFLINN